MNHPRRFDQLAVATVMASALFGATRADVSLHDEPALEAALEYVPCCVVDARAGGSRNESSLPDATHYREGLATEATGPVIVVADTDARALQAGRMPEGDAKDRAAQPVKKGVQTWQGVTLPDPGATLPKSFVIPSNTCQNAPPLQTLSFDPP